MKSESEVAQPCPTLQEPMDYSPPGSSVHGIFHARVLEWVAIALSSIPLSRTKMQETWPTCICLQWPMLFLCQLRLTADGNIYTQWVSSSHEIQAQESRQSSKSPKEAKDTNDSQPNGVLKLRVRSKFFYARWCYYNKGGVCVKQAGNPFFWCKDNSFQKCK